MTEFDRRMEELIDLIHEVVFEDKERLGKDTEYLKKTSDSIISISDELYWLRAQHMEDINNARIGVLKMARQQLADNGALTVKNAIIIDSIIEEYEK